MSRLARGLASAGFAVLRFDFTGGESGGDATSLCAREAPIYTRLMSNLEGEVLHRDSLGTKQLIRLRRGPRLRRTPLKAPPLPPGRLRPR